MQREAIAIHPELGIPEACEAIEAHYNLIMCSYALVVGVVSGEYADALRAAMAARYAYIPYRIELFTPRPSRNNITPLHRRNRP